MNVRENAGYTITNEITVGKTEIVLGANKASPKMFVTWECDDKTNYYWGHYFTDELSAQKDFCNRVLDKIRHIESIKKPKEPER